MTKEFIQKIKTIFTFILKSGILILICRGLIPVFAVFVVCVFVILGSIVFKNNTAGAFDDFFMLLLMLITGFLSQFLQIMLYYFISKKLGIIKVFDKLPFFIGFLIVIIYEIGILYQPVFYKEIENTYGTPTELIIGSSLIGCGYLYTFLTYKLAKFLIKKYPKQFNWIKKIYPYKLEQILSFKNMKQK